MKNNSTKKHVRTGTILIAISLSLVLINALVYAVIIYAPEIRSRKNIDGLEAKAVPVNDIYIPDDAVVIGLGEATHGNVEFQELKLQVLQETVERYDVGSISMELDFGTGIAINRYVHGGAGDPALLAESTGYPIYDTKQIADLIRWIHDYNLTAEDKVSFYGFDMQAPMYDLPYIEEFCNRYAILSAEEVTAMYYGLNWESHSVNKEAEKASYDVIRRVEAELVDNADKYSDDPDYRIILQACKSALYCSKFDNIDSDSEDEEKSGMEIRDLSMAENIRWIQEYEADLGHSRILISAHNGHVAASGQEFKAMGNNLRDFYGSGYFVIGTDFYYTSDNMNMYGASTERSDEHFCSADPLAEKAKNYPDGEFYINFRDLKESDGEIYTVAHSPMMMGSIGEGYQPMWHLMPSYIRGKEVPSKIFDAMIMVYDATPIRVVHQ